MLTLLSALGSLLSFRLRSRFTDLPPVATPVRESESDRSGRPVG
jgi:hypothetical protein